MMWQQSLHTSNYHPPIISLTVTCRRTRGELYTYRGDRGLLVHIQREQGLDSIPTSPCNSEANWYTNKHISIHVCSEGDRAASCAIRETGATYVMGNKVQLVHVGTGVTGPRSTYRGGRGYSCYTSVKPHCKAGVSKLFALPAICSRQRAFIGPTFQIKR